MKIHLKFASLAKILSEFQCLQGTPQQEHSTTAKRVGDQVCDAQYYFQSMETRYLDTSLSLVRCARPIDAVEIQAIDNDTQKILVRNFGCLKDPFYYFFSRFFLPLTNFLTFLTLNRLFLRLV